MRNLPKMSWVGFALTIAVIAGGLLLLHAAGQDLQSLSSRPLTDLTLGALIAVLIIVRLVLR